MKTVKVGDYLLWNGEPAKAVWEINQRAVGIMMLEPKKCPHCGEILGQNSFDVIPTSPQFQECAMPMQTIKEDNHD